MEKELFWNAVISNDKRFDGAFVYAVGTTKIYCKPSCKSKPPKRENVAFFRSPELAEKEGFRACLRCLPRSEKTDRQTDLVIRTCELIETDIENTLESLAERLNVSTGHLQRTFTRIVGVSPQKYKENRRLTIFKNELKQGGEIVDAIYESGFGSSSRLYENASRKLGMTPSKYKKGGKNMEIDFAITTTKIGKMIVAATGKGICSVSLADSAEDLLSALKEEFPNAIIRESDELLKEFINEIVENIEGDNRAIELPLDVRATAFQMRVWEELRKIPYGKTATYQEIAAKIGNKNAVRAVARACASNQVALVIPCHRVIRSDGSLSGYRWGVERKRSLLEHERSRSVET